ncbi:Ig-like domain-containing protein [Acetanaerobacterium elongatum]|uniref:Ig-like domain (Group 2) n=1 Tax=Acetanaerobacterium elongatum TaxID=258515 RepID=A0A1G9XFI6_9FIRM|nr:Ig-like domain-containing protein [Acetanaerobacterium elongatum]SDM95301.1 Ig-like domain (group 2) [Acetanaerobacterium elongatum]
MKKSFTRALCLLVTLAMLVSYTVLPVYAETTASVSQESSEPAASAPAVTGNSPAEENPAGASETAQQLPVIPNEPIAQAPTGGENEVLFTLPLVPGGSAIGDEPATGSGQNAALQVVVNYPNGKTYVKQGDIVTLLFKIINYTDDDRLHGTTTVNGKTVEKGIGAYKISLLWYPTFELYGTPVSKFTTATTPYALFEKNSDAANHTLNMVAVFSAFRNNKVEALNEAALLAADGLLATAQLKYNGSGEYGQVAMNVSSEFDYVGDDGAITTNDPSSNIDKVDFDSLPPKITVTDKKSDVLANQSIEVPLTSTAVSVDPFASVKIINQYGDIAKFSVLKGPAAYNVTDTDPSGSQVAFELTEPGTYTISATDIAGNTATGKVTVNPRVTGLNLALTGNTYIGETYTVTPTLVPAVGTAGLPAGDKKLVWKVTWKGSANDNFVKVNNQDIAGTGDGNGNYIYSWQQDSPAPVKFTATAPKNYTITAETAATFTNGLTRAHAALTIKSPVKVLDITIKAENNQTNLLSDPSKSVTVYGAIHTQQPITSGGAPTLTDFKNNGIEVTGGSRNTGILTDSAVSYKDPRPVTVLGKTTYYYDYTMVLTSVLKSNGICDAFVSCGDVTATMSFNVTNYNTALTKMAINQESSGLDFSSNKSTLFSLSLSDAANKSSMPVNPNDCILSSSNSTLLTVSATSTTQATVTLCDGARFVTAPTKVTVTAELKDDPQKHKATATYTIYPTERHVGVSITNMSVSPLAHKDAGGDGYAFTLNATSLPAEAQLETSVLGDQFPGGKMVISSANKSLVKFTTSNGSVAAVSDTGVVSVKGYGECYITATATDGSNVFDRVKVVSHKQVERLLSANALENNITRSGKIQFKISSAYPADATNKAMKGLVWQLRDASTKALITDLSTVPFKFDYKTGTITADANAPFGSKIMVYAVLPETYYDSGVFKYDDDLITEKFTVTVVDATNSQLSAFTGLVASSPTLKIGDTVNVKVNNKAFTDYANVQWSIGTEASISMTFDPATAPNMGIDLTAAGSTPGRRTIFASYMGKTLSIPITVYNEESQQSAKLTLEKASGSTDYKLFDRYTTTNLSLYSTYGPAPGTKKELSAAICDFTSSMPNLVSISDAGVVTVNAAQAANLSGNVNVTLTASIKDDPYNRKATKTITVTPKILPKTISSVDIFNQSKQPVAIGSGSITVDLNSDIDKLYNLIIVETRRDGTKVFLAPEDAKTLCALAAGDVFLSSGAEYEAVLAGLSFASANTGIATVNAKGIVTLTGKSSPTAFNITAAQAAGTYAAGETAPSATLALTVNQPCTAITLSQDIYTMKPNPTSDVSFTLKATTTPANCGVTWTCTDNPNVTVDAKTGRVTVKKGCAAGDTATIYATSAAIVASCKIFVQNQNTVERAANVSASTLYVMDTLQNPVPSTATLYFRTDATNINDIKIATSNGELLSFGTVTPEPKYNYGTTKKGYSLTVTPKKPGTAKVFISVAGSTYAETFNIYQFNTNGTALSVIPADSTRSVMLDSTVCYGGGEQELSVFLQDKSKKNLLAIVGNNIPKYLTFTSSNPNLLVVTADGKLYTRNLNTITSPVNVTVTAAIKGEPNPRKGSITFKVTPGVSASSLLIGQRDGGTDFLKKVNYSSLLDYNNNAINKTIYTDIGDPSAQRVFNLGAKVTRTDNTVTALTDSSMVSWASSNNSVASVDANGTVTVRGKGTALITAAAKDGSAVKDMVVIRVNNRPRVLNDVPRKPDGTPETVTIVAGGSYTIPYKLNTGTAGDYYISEYELVNVPTKGDVTIDQKTGRLTVKAGLGDISGITAIIHLKTNKIYVYDSSIQYERFRDGLDYTDNSYGTTAAAGNKITVNIPIQVVAKTSVSAKAITMYETQNGAPTTKKLSGTLNLCRLYSYQFYLQKTLTNGQVAPGTDAVISIERLNNTTTTTPAYSLDVALDPKTGCFTLMVYNAGNYRLNVALGGMTASYAVNVYYPWYKNADGTNLQPLTGPLVGSLYSSNAGGIVYSKICAEDCSDIITRPHVRLLPATGKSGWGGSLGYAEDCCTYTSSSPLVQVDSFGEITVAKYIPGEIKVTITATLINDPAKHVVSIPVTVTGQKLARSVKIKNGANNVTNSTITGLANKSTLRLSADCFLEDGTTPADNRNVVWSSSKTSVVTVDNTGKVTFVGTGTATVTAKAADGGGALATVNFEVKKNAIT